MLMGLVTSITRYEQKQTNKQTRIEGTEYQNDLLQLLL